MVTSPETSRLFNGIEGADKLTEENAKTFHSKVEKLLWFVNISLPDIETAIYFHYTQVKDLDIHGWGGI